MPIGVGAVGYLSVRYLGIWKDSRGEFKVPTTSKLGACFERNGLSSRRDRKFDREHFMLLGRVVSSRRSRLILGSDQIVRRLLDPLPFGVAVLQIRTVRL